MLTVKNRRCSDLDSFQFKLTEQLALLRIGDYAVCLFGLMLYVHGQQQWSCQDGQLSYPHCSWASPPEAGNQYLAHIISPLTDNCLNQRKRENGRTNNFMTKSSRKDVPDARIDRGAS